MPDYLPHEVEQTSDKVSRVSPNEDLGAGPRGARLAPPQLRDVGERA